LPRDTEKYSIRIPDDNAEFKASGFHTIRVAQIPQASNGIEMSWDYGFRVSMKGTVTVPDGSGGQKVSNCIAAKEYYLPTDFHNVISYKNDFDFIVRNVVPNPPLMVKTESLSTKFFDSSDLVGANRQKTYDNIASEVSSNLIQDPRLMAIFANTNFGEDSDGTPNARFGTDRPECSQNGGPDKKFEIRFAISTKSPGRFLYAKIFRFA